MSLSILGIWTTVSIIGQLTSTTTVIDNTGRDTHAYLTQSWYSSVIWTLVGASAAIQRQNRSPTALIAPAVILIATVLATTNYGLFIQYDKLTTNNLNDANHILFSENAIITLFIAYAATPNRFKAVAFIGALYIIFAGGGRSSLFIGIVAFLFYESLLGSKTLSITYTIILIGASLFILNVDDSDLIKRMLFTDGLTTDDSFVGRIDQLEQGLGQLSEQALWGNVTLIATQTGNIGNYIHNILSAWQFYGLAGFILCLTNAYRSNAKMYLTCKQESASFNDSAFALILIYATISIILTKVVAFGTFWLALGYWTFAKPWNNSSK